MKTLNDGDDDGDAATEQGWWPDSWHRSSDVKGANYCGKTGVAV